MNIRRLIIFGGILSLLLCIGGYVAAEERRKPVMVEGKKFLPLRVLARPFSHVYKEKDETKGTVTENVPAFQPYYVYSRPTAEERELEQGWYEVGTDNRGTIAGWMKKDDVFEWKQTMCLAFEHPEGRKPVLMFERRKPLIELIQTSPEGRIAKATEYYNIIDSKEIPKDFPVESIEPKKAVDISKEFYLLPILESEVIEIENREGRILKLAAVTGVGPDARGKTDIRENKEYLKAATEKADEANADIKKKMAFDLVWVMDTTVSMRPYIDKTLEVVKNVSQQISQNPELNEGLRFGIWGYRDSVDDIPGIGYTTKNYTPKLQTIGDFVKTLAEVKVTPVDSVDYPEDVYSGMTGAINKTNWTEGAIKVIMLVGDAPAHDNKHEWNLSKENETTLRSRADDLSIYIGAMYVKDPKAEKFHETGETQFKALSRNKGGGGESTYVPVASDDLSGYSKAASELTDTLNKFLSEAKKAGLSEKFIPEIMHPKVQTALMVQDKMPIKISEVKEAGCVCWYSSDTTFVIDLGKVFQVQDLIVEAGNKSAYAVEVSLNGKQYATFMKIESSVGSKDAPLSTQKVSENSSNRATQPKLGAQPARFIKVFSPGGDDLHSISEIRLSGTATADAPILPVSMPPTASVEVQPPVAKQPPAVTDSTVEKREVPVSKPDTKDSTLEKPTPKQLFENMIHAAVVEWIGSETGAKAPRDIEAWATDKDLITPSIQSMDVRLLINKRQLDSLTSILDQIMGAGRAGQVSGDDFFESLQATAATAARKPDQIKNANSLLQAGLVPEFLVGLPYESTIMAMNNELWASYSQDAQDRFLNDLQAKIRLYQTIHDSPDKWIALNKGDDPDDHVYPISLEMLP